MPTTSLLAVDPERLREVCERYGIAALDLFGSYARSSSDASSDIDLLYTLAPGRRLGWEIEDLSAELADILGHPVDLVSRRGLNARLRARVLSETQPLYAA